MAGVHQGVGEFTVIGENQQALGIHVQTANGIDPLAAVCHQLGRIGTALLVREGGHIATGLIQ